MKYDLEPRGWIVAEETFDPCRTAKCESIFAQGNGYINIRCALEEEAVASLKRAKRGHDALEALYRPCVDFDAVGALCDAEIARIGAYPV